MDNISSLRSWWRGSGLGLARNIDEDVIDVYIGVRSLLNPPLLEDLVHGKVAVHAGQRLHVVRRTQSVPGVQSGSSRVCKTAITFF